MLHRSVTKASIEHPGSDASSSSSSSLDLGGTTFATVLDHGDNVTLDLCGATFATSLDHEGSSTSSLLDLSGAPLATVLHYDEASSCRNPAPICEPMLAISPGIHPERCVCKLCGSSYCEDCAPNCC